MKKKPVNQAGTLIYRLFLLSIVFGVLWVKGYLWWAFIMTLLLFLGDTFLIPMLLADSNMPRDIPETTWPKPPRPKKSPSAPKMDDDAASPPAGGAEDFREPMPGRTSPRRK